MTVAEQIEMTWKEILTSVMTVMNYPFLKVGDANINLATLLTGILFLIVGYFLSKRASDAVEHRLLKKFEIEDSLRYTFGRFIFYFFLLITMLFTLQALAIPITIFAVLGGALAVGIGFGSQNLVNNFISGILVLLTRPIRVGDSIEVQGISGVVENIGIRATFIRTPRNAVMIIPNTVFIENSLTNWTMSNEIAIIVKIGVGYDTDVRKFTELAMKVVEAHPAVLKTPGPAVHFVDFGDNALLFDIAFSVTPNGFLDRKPIETDVRIRLNDALRAAKISIPFPQRELHLALKDMQRVNATL